MGDGKKVAVGVGAGLGAWAGASIGIAGFFGAISGVVPLALLGGYAAHKLHKVVTSGEAGKFADDVTKGYAQGNAETKARLAVLRAKSAAEREFIPVVMPTRKKPPKSP